MEFEAIEQALEEALAKLYVLMETEDFRSKPQWGRALKEVIDCLGCMADSADARKHLVDATSYRWFDKPSKAINIEIKEEVIGVVGLALAFQIDLHKDEDTGFPPSALISQYRGFRDSKPGAKWRATTAFSIALGSPFEPHHGGLINNELRDHKVGLFAREYQEDLRNVPAPEVELESDDRILAAQVGNFACRVLSKKPKQLAAVLGWLAGQPVKSGGNLRLGINNTVVAYLREWLLKRGATPADIEAMASIVRGAKRVLKKVAPKSIRVRRLVAELPAEKVRTVLRLVPPSQVSAWLRNAAQAGIAGGWSTLAAAASATMMV